MTYYYADPQKIREQKEKYEYIAKELLKVSEGVAATSRKLGSIANTYPGLRSTLNVQATNIETLKKQADSLCTNLETIAIKYETAEKKIIDHSPKKSSDTETVGNLAVDNDEVEKPKSVTWMKGEISGATNWGGIGVGGVLSGELLEASYDFKSGASCEWEKDSNGKRTFKELGINYMVAGEAHVAKGSAKGNIGYLSGEVNATVGEVSAQGGVGANLFQDGKLSPNVYASVEAEAVAAKGEAKVAVGSEHTNAHGAVSGEVGVAKAGAGIEAGKIKYEDSKGNEKEAYGVKVEAGAEAYLATGSASGGITIFGVDINVGVSGKVGGVGGKVGAYATTGGVKGTLSGGLGVGIGLEVEIDWSDFHLGW